MSFQNELFESDDKIFVSKFTLASFHISERDFAIYLADFRYCFSFSNLPFVFTKPKTKSLLPSLN